MLFRVKKLDDLQFFWLTSFLCPLCHCVKIRHTLDSFFSSVDSDNWHYYYPTVKLKWSQSQLEESFWCDGRVFYYKCITALFKWSWMERNKRKKKSVTIVGVTTFLLKHKASPLVTSDCPSFLWSFFWPSNKSEIHPQNNIHYKNCLFTHHPRILRHTQYTNWENG